MEIRQAGNKIELVGVVKEHKLEEVINKDTKDKQIRGSLTMKCGESEVEVRVYVGEKTKEGKVKKGFTTLKGFISGEYPTMATDAENATKVSMFGNGSFTPKFSESLYVKEGEQECRSYIQIELGFGNIKVDNSLTEEDFKATFDIEMFVSEIEDEVKTKGDEEEETGRVVVKGYVPTYNGGIFPLQVVAGIVEDEEGSFDFAEQIKDGISEGDSVNFWGDINYLTIINKVKKGGTMGRAKTEDKKDYIHDLVAIGADILEGDSEWEEEAIEAALKERAVKMKEKEDEAKEGNKKGSGLGGKKSSGAERKERRKPTF